MPTITATRNYTGLYQQKYTIGPGWQYTNSPEEVYWGAIFETGNGNMFSIDKTWLRTPGYRDIIKKRGGGPRWRNLPMNDFSFLLQRATGRNSGYYRDVTYKEVFPGVYDPNIFYMVEVFGDINAVPGCIAKLPGSSLACEVPSHDYAALEARCQTSFLNKVKDQKVNLVQAFGEHRQTARLFASTCFKVLEMARSLRRGDLRGAANALGTSASRTRQADYRRAYATDVSSALSRGVLELQYGWRPLIQDIYGSAELLAQKAYREIINRVRKGARDVTRTSRSVFDPQFGITYRTECVSQIDISYTSYFTSDEAEHTLAQLGITNPLAVAWELTPWSFVLDWLVPVGNYLQSLDATNGLSFQKGCRSGKQTITFQSWAHGGKKANGSGYTEYDGYLTWQEVSAGRHNIGTFPRTAFPSFKNPFSVEHAVNALALARQLLRR